MLVLSDAGANGVGVGGKRFDLGAGTGELGLMRFTALEAGEFLVFEAFGLGGGELDFVLDGFRLRRGLNRVELGAKTCSLFAMLIDFALEAGTQRILSCERGGDLCRVILCGGEGRFGAGDFAGERAQLLVEAATLQFEFLQFHEILNMLVHHVEKAYGMKRGGGNLGMWFTESGN